MILLLLTVTLSPRYGIFSIRLEATNRIESYNLRHTDVYRQLTTREAKFYSMDLGE